MSFRKNHEEQSKKSFPTPIEIRTKKWCIIIFSTSLGPKCKPEKLHNS